ncbi:MAG: multiple sugar transport system ATP-binding protein [Actinomycetota bacterium]|nr:multiple sugar transport system ATP-binding protein [Actinomycetota bacterium]
MPYSSAVTGVEAATLVYPDGSVALREATLLAEPGELMAVIGPSGSGKSSLLRAIAGLARLSRGSVVIGGEYTSAETEHRNVAMVFEQTELMPFLDVARNMSFPLDLRHVPREESVPRVEQHARGLHLEKLLPRKPATLSYGERARVGIGRSLVRTPEVFLLDEPLAHLDAGERTRMRRHISEVVKQAGITTFYVTHDQSEALSIGDRVAVINNGSVVQVAPARELYDQPANTFIADIIATVPIGLLQARLVVAGGLAGYEIEGRTLPTWLPLPPGLGSYRDLPVLLGVRAEDVHEHPTPDDGTVSGVVSRVEVYGADAMVSLLVGEHQLTARFDGRTTVRPGAVITVGIAAARAHVFDPDTRTALAHPRTE